MQSHGLALSQCGDREEEDLELSFLLKNIKFIVTGNNHSNSVLLGLHGTVEKKTVGFGHSAEKREFVMEKPSNMIW